MDTNKILAIVAIAVIAAPLMSLATSMIARALFIRNTPEPARERLKQVEESIDEVAALRKAGLASQEEMEKVLAKVIENALTEARGERLLHQLQGVQVEGDPSKKEVLLKSAERSLRERFSTKASVASTP
jgi:Na+-transporting NADH:ubiquinone oxidoreductase subunit NqrC